MIRIFFCGGTSQPAHQTIMGATRFFTQRREEPDEKSNRQNFGLTYFACYVSFLE